MPIEIRILAINIPLLLLPITYFCENLFRMTDIRKVSLIGSGHLATNLGRELFNIGIGISAVYSRNKKNADALASRIGSKGVERIKELPGNSDLYIIAVSDEAISTCASELNHYHGYELSVVHTSGTVASAVLEKHFRKSGVMYFLQSFTKSRKAEFQEIPCFITTNNVEMKKNLAEMAIKLTGNAKLINDEKRKILHLAAVFCNNFVNNLYSASKKIMNDESLPFEYLYPLIKETAARITEGNDPNLCQTGPARRSDHQVITEHIEYLEKYPEIQAVYDTITKNITSEQKK